MIEKYSFTPATPRHKAEASVSNLVLYKQQQAEKQWLENHAYDDPATQLLLYTVDLAKAHTIANTRRSTSESYTSPSSPRLSPSYEFDDHYLVALLDTDTSNITLSSIFENADIASEKPIEVYGHMLRSTFHAQTSDHRANFLPVTTYTPSELGELLGRAAFPTHIETTLVSLSHTFQRALRCIQNEALETHSAHSEPIAALYTELQTHGTELQRDLFHAHVLGVTDPDRSGYAYHKLRQNLEENDSAVYETWLGVVEDAYDGLLGEEAYELLGLKQDTTIEASQESFEQLNRQKRTILKLVKDNQGTFALPDGVYGSVSLLHPKVHHLKYGAKTHLNLETDVLLADNHHLPLSFGLTENGTYNWSFLRTPDEVPELFNFVTATTISVFDSYTKELRAQRRPAMPEVPGPSSKKHVTDAIYTERKKHKEEYRKASQQGSLQDELTTQPNTSLEPKQVVFPESIASDLIPEWLAKANLAIDKYKEGVISAKFLVHISNITGKKMYRLRQGGMRVLLELTDEGSFIVSKVGTRGRIYRDQVRK